MMLASTRPRAGQREADGMVEQGGGHGAGTDAVALAQAYYLDDRHQFGCAETSYIVLKVAFDLDDPTDPSAAVALNGGIAYSGGLCGALTGAALAVGMLAERRIHDHARAKRVAREIVAGALEAFREEHGAVDCRELIGYDLRAPGGHDAFLASGSWRDGCMRQIASVVGRLAGLADPAAWDRAVREVEAPPEG
jgi:C_GCAxxG_C_C family probable redox protein